MGRTGPIGFLAFVVLILSGCEGGPCPTSEGGPDAGPPDAEALADADADDAPLDADASESDGDADDAASGADADREGDAELAPRPAPVPIIFIHGHGGSHHDWADTIRWLVENDSRWDGFMEAGTATATGWEVGSIPETYWLFNFTYYNLFPSDARGAYTAGPGRVGSNDEHWCDRFSAPGYLPASNEAYDGDEVVHEYSRDLAEFIEAVVEVTGSESVDLVGHSMGGLVARAAIQFHGSLEQVRRVLLVAVPNHGIDLVDLAVLDPTRPRWMVDREFVELDATVSFWEWGFRDCSSDDEEDVSWTMGLNVTDREAARRVTFFTMSGDADLAVSRESASYVRSEWHVAVPGTGHAELLDAPQTREAVRDHLGHP